MPDSVRMETKQLSNSTLITWQAPNIGKVKGYYILRETAEPMWQKKIFTTATEIPLN